MWVNTFPHMPTDNPHEPAEVPAPANPKTIGTGIGAATGAVAGAGIGAPGGPIGAAVGAVIGAVAGGIGGMTLADDIDPQDEDAYWREQHARQSFRDESRTYEEYAPAYRTGYGGYQRGKTFAEREAELREAYERESSMGLRDDMSTAYISAGASPMGVLPVLPWEKVREAARAAYERMEARQRPEVKDPAPNDPLD